MEVFFWWRMLDFFFWLCVGMGIPIISFFFHSFIPKIIEEGAYATNIGMPGVVIMYSNQPPIPFCCSLLPTVGQR